MDISDCLQMPECDVSVLIASVDRNSFDFKESNLSLGMSAGYEHVIILDPLQIERVDCLVLQILLSNESQLSFQVVIQSYLPI